MKIVTKFFVVRFHEGGQQTLITGPNDMIKPASFILAEGGRRGLEFPRQILPDTGKHLNLPFK